MATTFTAAVTLAGLETLLVSIPCYVRRRTSARDQPAEASGARFPPRRASKCFLRLSMKKPYWPFAYPFFLAVLHKTFLYTALNRIGIGKIIRNRRSNSKTMKKVFFFPFFLCWTGPTLCGQIAGKAV